MTVRREYRIAFASAINVAERSSVMSNLTSCAAHRAITGNRSVILGVEESVRFWSGGYSPLWLADSRGRQMAT
jgi:hypothetical protein